MYRITAINNESDTEEEDDTKVTKEAEETIIMSEYMRALKLQKESFIDDALSLFSELLETEILFEVTKTHTSKSLISIKYNCYKNIALIHSNRKDNDLALEFLLKAIELDDTDVYTVNKLGQIALNLKQFDVAQMAFEKCLKTNPTHWPSGDGILQILCQREEYNEAYGWALRWYDKNPKYTRALDVILEIREKFGICGLEYIENAWSIKFKEKSLNRANKKSAFPDPEFEEEIEPGKPDIEEFKVESFDKLNWYTLGSMILKLYEYLSEIDNGSALSSMFESTDFLLEAVQTEPMEEEVIEETITEIIADAESKPANETDNDVQIEDKQDNSNSESTKCAMMNPEGGNSVDGSTEDSDAQTTGDDGSKSASAKPKSSRRRGSDLKLLDPWFYWKNRKYSQRQKNKQIERMETDTTINGFLRKILEKYFEDNFDDESPFHPDSSNPDDRSTATGNESDTQNMKSDKFQELTADLFAQLISEIKESSFSVITLIGKWIDCISKYWEQKIPDDILELYLKLFQNYLNHHNISTWNLLNEDDFQAVFRMTLFYLELKLERSMKTAEPNVKNDVDEDWLLLFNHTVFHSGLFEFDTNEAAAMKYQKRLNWLQYCLCRYEYDLRRSVNCLETIRDLIISHDDTLILTLPNQTHNNKIDLQTVNESIVMLERMINLNNVQQLYTDQKYTELIEILKDSIVNTTKSKNIENTVMKLSEQFEIILECFWSLNTVEECLIWCERCLKYAVDRFLGSSNYSSSYAEWAKSINFILTYIEAIILDESYLIVNCLGRQYARLIQSIVRIVSHQLDTEEKNNNQAHPVNLKTPWVILHHILQREEDMKPRKKRKFSNDTTLSNENEASGEEEEATDSEEELIPKSVSIFFTAHEYLGNRTWCSKDNGQFLLFIMDTVTPRLRTPYLERCRNEIIEYLEQVTYCLYRYPGRKARLKHLEKHESPNIELDWNHAIQLYDIYRPDKMPEFDMFKRDSITTEMEQLLQRIIAIIPAEIDLSTRCEAMEKFISGELSELPKPLDILPYHINSIYYLLADYYFKNKEFSKALKYYICDLSNLPTRFDAWAGLALSKAHLMGTKLNSCTTSSPKEWVQDSEEVLRCFEQCLKIDEQQHMLWIEYGNYAYVLHSYCSRCLKQADEGLSMDEITFLKEKKEQCLKITHDSFITIDNMKPIPTDDESENTDDEKWLYHYMLGKVSEKRKEPPNVVIEHYLKSAQYLYDNNATYPFKISSVNPQNLSLEALEIFYRITATIIKYLEQHPVITHGIGKFFIKILKQQAKSPFALSQAKINENILNAHLQRKRKLNMTNEETNKQKMAKADTNQKVAETKGNESPSESIVLISVQTEHSKVESTDQPMETDATEGEKMSVDNESKEPENVENSKTTAMQVDEPPNPNVASTIEENVDSPLRRGSQESTATTTTQTTTTTSTDSTSSSSDSSSSDSSSDSDDSSSESDSNKDENAPLDEKRIDFIYKMCIKNLEECITRYPEHYKSIYRLVLIYMNGPEKIKDVNKCNQLLLGTYTTELGNQVQGLFTDRKNNNLFNGFWRNKSSEIERPGSFSSHLSKCVNILMQTLRISQDFKLLLEIVFHMQRVPDADKRYIKDSERKELLDHAMTFCVQAFMDLLKKHGVDQRNDNEILTLLIEVFKAHKKLKNVSQKESPFSTTLVETYKSYAEGKVWLQENVNYLDSANKFCVCLMNGMKNQEKQQQLTGVRQTLEELGIKNLGASLSKINTSFPGTVTTGNQTPTGGKSPAVIPKVPTSTPVPINIPTTTTATITTIAGSTPVTSTTSMTTITPVTARPRGRPPGSKNTVSKATSDVSKNAAMQQKLMASILQPFAGSLSNLELITSQLDPQVKVTVLALLAEPQFMKTLAMFPDPTSRNTLLREYFTYSNSPNVQQLIDGFNSVFNYLASALQPQASLANIMPVQMKTSKPDKTPSVPKSSPASMSIFPTANKPHPSLTTSPSKPSVSPSISATITPVSSSSSSSSQSLLKSNASTIISVGSGQLTITPSISITPNLTKPTSVLPQMPAPTFSVQKPVQPKVRRSTGDKPAKASQKAQRLSQGSNVFPNLPPIAVENLPRSLSIIPSPSSFGTTKPSAISPVNVGLIVNKPLKVPKPKKKSIDGNKSVAQSKKLTPQIPGIDPNLMKKSLANQLLQSQLNPLLNQYNYLSNYEQFLSGVPQTPLQPPKPSKSKTSTVTSAGVQQQKGGIKVKQLDQLQGRVTKVTDKQAPKSKQQPFSVPNMAANKNQPESRSPAVLNAYGTTISSVTHPTQSMPTSFSPLPTAAAPTAVNLSSLQISPTKTLQQKLAERQRQFHDANSQSRPSSTSSAGSAKTRKSDTEVIVLD